MNNINHKIRSELDTVYITSDGRKFLKYIDALYSQSEIDKGIEIKLSKKDGNPLYKINLVDDDDIERALINTLTKDEPWKHSETNLNQKKT